MSVSLQHRQACIQYVLDILLDGTPVEVRSKIRYEVPEKVPRSEKCVCIAPSGFFGPAYGTLSSLPSLPLKRIGGIPLLYGEPRVERHGDHVAVFADVVASSFLQLTRYEEWVRGDVRDEHGRFPGRESLPFRAGFLHRPIVDGYAALLRKWASQAGIELPAPKRRFSVLLTHDVDSVGRRLGLLQAARGIAGGLLGRRPLRQALSDAAVSMRLRRHPEDNLNNVIQRDRQLTGRFPTDRCRVIYFFMAGGNLPQECAYRLGEARIIDRIRKVSASGAEIGLHASYEAGTNPAKVAIERQALQQACGLPIEKNRHHFLSWREPEHGGAIAEAGINWDATMGYADVAGFRLGVCRPVPLFDPIRQCLLGIEEHPLIVMDCTLNMAKYMNLGEEAAFDHVCRLADATFQHQGEFVILWHNTMLANTDASYHKRLYPRVLDYLGKLMEEGSEVPGP